MKLLSDSVGTWIQRVSVGSALATLGVVPLAPTPAVASCSAKPVRPLPGTTAQPWAQRIFDPHRMATLGADGSGVTVAVIDSGVDARHPQLKGHVAAGWDAFDPAGNGQEDCVGHGTAVASLIAAQPAADTSFRGLAPGATVLPIRANERVDGNTDGRGSGDDLARAIKEAVKRRARVINMSLVLAEDRPDVRAAVADAIAHDAVVVAAVGNNHGGGSTMDPPSYPAAYPGVIGVGAVDENGVRLAKSQVGAYVDLVAPGGQVQAAVPGGGFNIYDGTSMAAPLVSAAAALVIQSQGPNVSARQVAARLMAAADPAPAAPGSPEYGYGVLDPYRAVAEIPAREPPKQLPALPPPRRDPAAEAAAASAAHTHRVSLLLAGGLAVLAIVMLLAMHIAPRGRQRGWRPAGEG